ncbi:hypothetical protein MKEN_00234300 [Mycena kentingensis (nom. inval.)]|nr:hypothetical protein MKEN_00234300 [Mycena kentingensis (nom. inval.)]
MHFKLPFFVLLSCSAVSVLAAAEGGMCAVCPKTIIEKEYKPSRTITFELVEDDHDKESKTTFCGYLQKASKYLKEEDRQQGFCSYDHKGKQIDGTLKGCGKTVDIKSCYYRDENGPAM